MLILNDSHKKTNIQTEKCKFKTLKTSLTSFVIILTKIQKNSL